ncbi:putative uncharacterized protein DDB_G0267840 [Melanaphis sacchari]|uniref:putative uncharacterized protein DDB_G0267840 n=1 Tax=Melanaphis sacchari TaxID=742174 RepID=UPI000DC1475E|nr:putative uncharacterized protein DDB_G0267840 [Melanaphis sacchari]
MALKTDNMYVSCIKVFGVPIVPPLMTDKKRHEMKEYKEKAIAYEHKFKGKRVSLDSGVMITSTEMQKNEKYESPTTVLKEPVYSDVNINKITILNGMKTDGSISPETPTLISEEDELNFDDSSSNKQPIIIKSETINLIEKSDDTLIPKQESKSNLTVNNSITHYEDNLNASSLNKELSIKSENHNLIQNPCDTLVPKQEPTQLLTVTNATIHVDEENITTKQIPRLRSNSYTLSSPSPIMVAFLNSQVQQQLMEPKSLENNINYSKESKSEPLSIYMTNDYDEKILKAKSLSLNSVPKSFYKHEITKTSIKPSFINKYTENNIISDQNQDEKGSLTTIGTNFSNDESIVGSVITVFNSNSYDNNSSPNSMTSKSIKHCCCRHSDDEYSISSSNIRYKTPEELNLEAEELRIAKLDLEKRHQEELSSLIRKQREEQEKIAVRYYLVSQSTSGMSFDGSECSESISKQISFSSPSIQSGMTVTNDKSILSDTSSVISSCSVNKNLVCSSPRQRISPRSPHLQQNIKFYHRIRGGSTAKWTRAPTEVENSAATIINAGVRGYLTRRLLRTEKAQMFKKTILDSLKTALIMHMELKKQQPTESDLELHRRIINQLTTACYDLNDLILGSVHERMTVIRSDRERLMAVKMRRKSSSALVINKQSPILKQPKKSRSGYSLSKKASGNFSEKSSFKKH